MSREAREVDELVPLPVERCTDPARGTQAPEPPARNPLRLAMAVGLLLAVLAGGRALSRVRGEDPAARRVAEPTRATPGSDEPAPPGWRRGTPGPLLHRDHAAQVWTGAELVVWGGDPDGDAGAAYDPFDDEWRAIAPAPIPARCQSATAWTGREVLVWGRACRLTPDPSPGPSRYPTAGAAYDPAADRWRVLPPAPIDAGSVTTSVWTGDEWVVFNPGTPTGSFDPAGGQWRTLPPVPHPFASLVAQWTGREALVLGTEMVEDGPSTGATYRHWAAALDPASGRWRELPPPPLELAATAVWDGRRLIAWDQNLAAIALDPTADRAWEHLAGLPVDFTDCSPQGDRIGSVVFAEHCGQGALWRPSDRTWERIAHPKSLAEVPVWTGEDALFWVGRFAGSADGVWLYRPSPD